MIVLGINAYHGDAAACIVADGEIKAACEEERFNRIKHSAGFPVLAIHACLEQANIPFEKIDRVGISRNPKANLSKKIRYVLKSGKKMSVILRSRLANAYRVIHLRDELERFFPEARSSRIKIHQVEHHLAHMASAYYPSPFDQAAILSIDGFGDFVSTKWGIGQDNGLTVQGQIEFPHSMGILYTALTQYLGFPHYGDEFKVMALAAYGRPRYEQKLKEIIRSDSKGNFSLNLDYFLHASSGVEMNWKEGYPHLSACFSPKLIELLGPGRASHEPITERHYDIAASLQKTFENIYFGFLRSLFQKNHLKNLCLAGGCAFNSVANGKIREETPYEHIFIQPAAGDAGTALGAALYLQHTQNKKQSRIQPMNHVYLGPEFEAKDIKSALALAGFENFREMDQPSLIRQTAQSLAQGKIVGWFQGRMEFGPRALGNRSLLADPRRPETREWLNRRIKARESFRPFAPAVLKEAVPEYFEAAEADFFMTRVFKIRAEKQPLIPAVCHVDGTGRLQAVAQETNPKFWLLLRQFQALTGIPVLLNTSFNENEPIVCTPEQAIQCFKRNEIDVLAIGNFFIRNRTETLEEDACFGKINAYL